MPRLTKHAKWQEEKNTYTKRKASLCTAHETDNHWAHSSLFEGGAWLCGTVAL
jgi:hypothetical protein